MNLYTNLFISLLGFACLQPPQIALGSFRMNAAREDLKLGVSSIEALRPAHDMHLARNEASNQRLTKRIMIFSAADQNAQPAVISYEKMPEPIPVAAPFFMVAEERMKLEEIENALLVPVQRRPLTDDRVPIIDEERKLPEGMTDEDLQDKEPASEKTVE